MIEAFIKGFFGAISMELWGQVISVLIQLAAILSSIATILAFIFYISERRNNH